MVVRADVTHTSWVALGAGAGFATLLLPAVLLHAGPSAGDLLAVVVAIALASLGAAVARRQTREAVAPFGALIVGVSA